MRYAFVKDHRRQFPPRLACALLGVSAAGYYAWLRRCEAAPGPRLLRRLLLSEQVRDAHQRSGGIYGSPRVHRELVARGVSVCENTVARLMRRERIRSVVKRRFRVPRTTDSDHAHPVAANLLERNFNSSPAPDRVWAADLTYVPTEQGWLYLAVVMDLCSRRIVGWAMADHLRGELAIEALHMAVRQRRPPAGLLHHSDRGVQYACRAYQQLLQENQMICSMSRRGDCYDNAPVESFFGTLKRERVHHQRYATHQQARASIFQFIEVFYNRQRRHSAVGYQSPEAFEASLN